MKLHYALRDDQWKRIKELLPGRAGSVGVTAKDNHLFVEAVLYRYRARIPWRNLPERFGDFRIVHTRHNRWARSNENFFLKLKHFRAMATRYGKTACTFLAANVVLLA